MEADRRQFIRYVVTGPLLAGCPLHAIGAPRPPAVASENFAMCHRVRDGDSFPQPAERKSHDLVIIGGGVSGLTVAYHSRDRDFLLIEKEPQFGGNSQTHELGDMSCSIGAAYIGQNDSAGKLAVELGLQPLPVSSWDGTVDQGVFTPDTWGEGLDLLPYERKVRQQFAACRRDILALGDDTDKYDHVSWAAILKPYGPEVLRWWDTFCPSNWGGKAADIAATMGIDELQWWAGSNRQDTRATWPGGVGRLTRRLAEVVRDRHADRLIDEATVLAVKLDNDRVHVTYWKDGRIVGVEAKAVIIAAPKYITSRLVTDLPRDQREAMQKISYIPYCVVNVLYDSPVRRLTFDTWFPGRRFTDVINADWVVRDRPGPSSGTALTCYVPLPESERESLLSADWCRTLAENVVKDLQASLPDLNVQPREVHLYRRGHAIHTAAPGISRHQVIARRPYGRIAFAHTDVAGFASSTSGAIRSARRAVEEIDRYL